MNLQQKMRRKCHTNVCCPSLIFRIRMSQREISVTTCSKGFSKSIFSRTEARMEEIYSTFSTRFFFFFIIATNHPSFVCSNRSIIYGCVTVFVGTRGAHSVPRVSRRCNDTIYTGRLIRYCSWGLNGKPRRRI